MRQTLYRFVDIKMHTYIFLLREVSCSVHTHWPLCRKGFIFGCIGKLWYCSNAFFGFFPLSSFSTTVFYLLAWNCALWMGWNTSTHWNIDVICLLASLSWSFLCQKRTCPSSSSSLGLSQREVAVGITQIMSTCTCSCRNTGFQWTLLWVPLRSVWIFPPDTARL